MILSADADAAADCTPARWGILWLAGGWAGWLADWLVGRLNVWHHGVTIIPSNTQKPEEDLAAAAAQWGC